MIKYYSKDIGVCYSILLLMVLFFKIIMGYVLNNWIRIFG